MGVNIKFIVTNLSFENEAKIATLIVLFENLWIYVMLLFCFDSCILLVYEIKSLVNDHVHLGVKISKFFLLDFSFTLVVEHLQARFY